MSASIIVPKLSEDKYIREWYLLAHNIPYQNVGFNAEIAYRDTNTPPDELEGEVFAQNRITEVSRGAYLFVLQDGFNTFRFKPMG